MKILTCLTLLLLCYQGYSQYYYKDLVSATEVMRQMKTLKENNVNRITATGITPEGNTTAEFNENYEIGPGATSIKVTTRINETVSSLLHRFDEMGRLTTTIDSSAGLISTSNYQYDASGKIISISNKITDKDSTQDFTQTEAHFYFYRNNNPEKMWRVINKTDSLEIRFVQDEYGNVIEERAFRKGIGSDPLYYYYDDKNRLTDIVRYNYKVQRLLPDFLFEYDANNRVIQKIATIASQNLGYLTWRYLFNEKGLKTKEALFNKEKELLGRIDYTYY